ncbi:hypothetical protein L1887_61966 [Cichorium endivia]|nr:hypothetical protein L1887_61966 [Cichorium endivia]
MERRLALRGRWIYSMEASSLERARLFLSPLCARDRRDQIKENEILIPTTRHASRTARDGGRARLPGLPRHQRQRYDRGRAGLRDIAARLHCRQPDEPETQPGPSLSTPRRGLSLPRRCPVEWQTGSLLVGFTEDLPVTGEQRSDSVSVLAYAHRSSRKIAETGIPERFWTVPRIRFGVATVTHASTHAPVAWPGEMSIFLFASNYLWAFCSGLVAAEQVVPSLPLRIPTQLCELGLNIPHSGTTPAALVHANSPDSFASPRRPVFFAGVRLGLGQSAMPSSPSCPPTRNDCGQTLGCMAWTAFPRLRSGVPMRAAERKVAESATGLRSPLHAIRLPACLPPDKANASTMVRLVLPDAGSFVRATSRNSAPRLCICCARFRSAQACMLLRWNLADRCSGKDMLQDGSLATMAEFEDARYSGGSFAVPSAGIPERRLRVLIGLFRSRMFTDPERLSHRS